MISEYHVTLKTEESNDAENSALIIFYNRFTMKTLILNYNQNFLYFSSNKRSLGEQNFVFSKTLKKCTEPKLLNGRIYNF